MTASSNDIPFTPRREEPLTFRARTLGVSLTVKDLARSIAWYRDIAAFVVDETWERDGKMVGASLKAGDVEMLLNQDDGAKGWDRVKGEGFSMMLTTTMDIDRYAADIKSRGGVLETEPADMPWGARVFRLKDPDGFKLVISKEIG
jgi:uncharacterized glyoxalase superfamily protein PhnB